MFDLLCLDKIQLGMLNKHHYYYQMYQKHKNHILQHLQSMLFHLSHIVNIVWHLCCCRYLFEQILKDNFYILHQMYLRHKDCTTLILFH